MTPRRRRALLAVNPHSRRGADASSLAASTLRDAGLDVVEAACDEVPGRLAGSGEGFDCVVLGGGDGTLNAAAGALRDADVPMGVLPLGTANDFARSVGIPLDVAAAARVIAAGTTRRVDLGLVNGHPFFNVASLGLAADLAQSLTTERKRRFGRLSYALTAAHLLLSARPFHARLSGGGEDGAAEVRTLQVSVGNGRFYGGGNVVAVGAAVDDALLHLYSLEFSAVWRCALMLPSFKHGAHGAIAEVRTAQGPRFEVVTRRPRPINADGELLTQTPAVFTVAPAALAVYVPDDNVPKDTGPGDAGPEEGSPRTGAGRAASA